MLLILYGRIMHVKPVLMSVYRSNEEQLQSPEDCFSSTHITGAGHCSKLKFNFTYVKWCLNEGMS